MSDQGHSFQLALVISASVELTTVMWTDHPVVADEPGHCDGMKRPFRQESEDLGFLTFLEGQHCDFI
jgi:hypothetical protein